MPSFNNQYKEFQQQVLTQLPILHKSQLSNQTPQLYDLDVEEDLDMDAQSENVLMERGGSSLQVSYEHNPQQATHSSNPYTSLRAHHKRYNTATQGLKMHQRVKPPNE